MYAARSTRTPNLAVSVCGVPPGVVYVCAMHPPFLPYGSASLTARSLGPPSHGGRPFGTSTGPVQIITRRTAPQQKSSNTQEPSLRYSTMGGRMPSLKREQKKGKGKLVRSHGCSSFITQRMPKVVGDFSVTTKISQKNAEPRGETQHAAFLHNASGAIAHPSRVIVQDGFEDLQVWFELLNCVGSTSATLKRSKGTNVNSCSTDQRRPSLTTAPTATAARSVSVSALTSRQ